VPDVGLEVHVVTPEREVWTGRATEVIARGVEGDVGILAGHAPLLIRLAVGPLQVLREDGDRLRAVVDGGFLHVSTEEGSTRVDVLATTAQLAEEIDVEAARRRLEELGPVDADDEAAKQEAARAEARIALVSSA
jgi:F-type H+-transporting ATPase subunit epsilon